MDSRRLVTVSKFFSKHLRHAPEELGLELEPGGWVRVEDLLAGCERVGFRVSWAELREVVEKNDKQRFSFDESGERIRANRRRVFVGSPATVSEQLAPVIAATTADELMITTMIYDHEARKHSYELLAKAFKLSRP